MRFSNKHFFWAVSSVVALCVICSGYWLCCTQDLSVTTPHTVLPQNASLFDQGEYYFNHGKYADGTYDLAKAQSYFEQAIALDPKSNELLWYQSGRIDFLNGDFDGALLKFQKQIEYFGDSVPNVYYMIGLTYGYKARRTNDPSDWTYAEEGFKKAIIFAPKAPWPYVDLSWLYFAQGKYMQMIPALNQALLFNPNNPWLLNMYGLALLNENRTTEAHEYFLKAYVNAQSLTETEWGRSYPGNDPNFWGQGLYEFRAIIEKNIAITSSSL